MSGSECNLSLRDDSTHARLNVLSRKMKFLIRREIIAKMNASPQFSFCGELGHGEYECTYGMGFSEGSEDVNYVGEGFNKSNPNNDPYSSTYNSG